MSQLRKSYSAVSHSINGCPSISCRTSQFAARTAAARYYTGPLGRPYDVSPDGQRFLMIKNNTGTDQAPSMVVVVNWLEELKAKLPAK